MSTASHPTAPQTHKHLPENALELSNIEGNLAKARRLVTISLTSINRGQHFKETLREHRAALKGRYTNQDALYMLKLLKKTIIAYGIAEALLMEVNKTLLFVTEALIHQRERTANNSTAEDVTPKLPKETSL